MKKTLFAVVLSTLAGVAAGDNIAPKLTAYNEHPTKENLEARELFRQRGFGLFIHYGLYSVSGEGEWQLFQDSLDAKKYYAERLPHFKPKAGCVDEWIRLAKDAGMRYIVLTTRHHEGYWLGDDFIREYTTKVRAAGLGVGVYFSVADWSDPGYRAGSAGDPEGWRKFVDKAHFYLRHLMKDFGKIEYLFYDGCPPPLEWDLMAINAEMRRLQPYLLICRGHMDCDFKSCEGNTNFGDAPLWEACYTFNRSWGYNKRDFDFKPLPSTIEMFFSMRHNGGNFLLNVGPMADGTVQKEAVDRLREIGKWVKKNHEAIFDIVPHPFEYAPRELLCGGLKDKSVAYWMTDHIRVRDGRVINGIANKVKRLTYLDSGEEIPFTQDNAGLTPRLILHKMRPCSKDDIPYIVKIELEGPPKGVFNERLPKFAGPRSSPRKEDVVKMMHAKNPEGRIRAVQVDLARQMETTTFLSNYIDRVASYGINTLQLYLEGRVGTKTFSLPDGERYTAREMRDLVAHASEKGLTVIPVVSLLGHAEHFFKYPGHEDLSEESCGRTRWGGRPCTFCLSNPKTRKFLESYVAELCEIFPGPYFHVGFDESWNMGFCDRCAEKSKRDGGDDLFAEFVTWAHGVCKKQGKRMMMWDDFFGFHLAALDKIPRDIILCQWNYDSSVSNRGPRFNFGGNERTDWLKLYEEKRFDALTVSWYETENIRTLADYDHHSKSLGFVVAQWEDLADSFHGGSLPRIPARVLMDCAPAQYQVEDAFLEAVRLTYPSLNECEARAALELLHSSPPRCLPISLAAALAGKPRLAGAVADELSVTILRDSSVKPLTGPVDQDPLCERALLEDLIMRAQTGLVDETLRKVAPRLSDVRRTAEDVRAAQSELCRIRPLVTGLIDRRHEQERLWRNGCASCQPGGVAAKLVAALKFIDELLAVEARPAPADEKRLELCFTLSDVYGVPRWTVWGRFADGWREIAKGGWKPGQGEGATFSRFVTFSADAFPSEIRIDYKGCGAGWLRYLQMESADKVVRPKSLVSVSGDVFEAENVLRDDLRAARLGTEDAIAAIKDPSRSECVSSITVAFPTDERVVCSGVRVCREIAYKPNVKPCVLDLSVPTAMTGFPTVVWFHGGGLTGGHRRFIDIDTNRIAVATVEYRLMKVDGQGVAVPGGAISPAMILDDCAAAAAWVKRNIAAYGGDPKRVFVSGHSAGGYVTHLIGLDAKWLKPYGLTPFDFAGYLPVSGQATKHFAVRQYDGQGADQLRPVVDEWAPIRHIAAKTPPFCLLLGDRKIEWPMRVEESEFMYLSMKAMGNKSVEFHSFPGTNHGTCLKPSLVQLMHFIAAH